MLDLILFSFLCSRIISRFRNALITLSIGGPSTGVKNKPTNIDQGVKNEVTFVNNAGVPASQSMNEGIPKSATATKEDLVRRKKLINVLFIDDDTTFNIVKILNNAGWNTKIIKDVGSLDDDKVLEAHILFVDIRGVGVKLGLQEEGLTLAKELKNKFPRKKVIIYSAESVGNRFHKALRSVDEFLSKDAESLEFLELVDQFSAQIDL